MADEYEEEGVGDCSSRRLLGVRLAVRELMREALHSKENSEILADLRATGISDLGTLLQEKRRLVQEKRSCEVEIELRKRLSENSLSDTTLSLEDLEERVAELEREVSTARSRLSQNEQLIQRLQSSEVLTKHLFQRPDPTAEDKALRAAVSEQCEVSGKVGRMCGELGEGEREVLKLKRERNKCQLHCRELVAQIQALGRELAEERGVTEEVVRLRELVEAKTAECHLLQGCLQGVIVGSGVDWSVDQQLRELTVSLDHTLPWEHSH